MAWIPLGYRGRPPSDTGAEDAAVTIVEIERRQLTERRHRHASTHSNQPIGPTPHRLDPRRRHGRVGGRIAERCGKPSRRRHVEDTAGVDGRSVSADLAPRNRRRGSRARRRADRRVRPSRRRSVGRRDHDRARLGRCREPLLSRLGPGDRQKGRRRRVRSRNDPVACVGHRGRHHVASDQHPVPDHERQPPGRRRVRPARRRIDVGPRRGRCRGVGPVARRPPTPVRVRRTVARP